MEKWNTNGGAPQCEGQRGMEDHVCMIINASGGSTLCEGQRGIEDHVCMIINASRLDTKKKK